MCVWTVGFEGGRLYFSDRGCKEGGVLVRRGVLLAWLGLLT